jgi:hypothetical protein
MLTAASVSVYLPMDYRPFLLVLLIPFALICEYLEALATGWIGLARKFRYKGAPYPYQWPRENVRIQYRWTWISLVNVGADKEGLYMAEPFPFRIAHPPLFIPWTEIQVVSGEQGRIFKKRKLMLGRKELFQISISVSLAEEMKGAAGQSWPGDTFWS